MVTPVLSRTRRLAALVTLCLLGLLPALTAWLVNVEEALRVLNPRWIFVEALFPVRLYHAFAPLAADLSSVSTLTVVLLLLFPLMLSCRVLLLARKNPAQLYQLVYDPYPPHFPFFLVMLGLSGTLYGLLIGLNVSGVSQLGASVASPETIQQTLDQLLDGTATALLSSLMGLVGAFVAARPMTWVFHWAACLPDDDEPVSMTETVQHVTRDLHALGAASRAFSERLDHTALQDLPDLLTGVRDAMVGLRQDAVTGAQRLDAMLEQIVAGQGTTAARLQQMDERAGQATRELSALHETVEKMAREMSSIKEYAEQTSRSFTAWTDAQREQTDTLVQAAEAAEHGRHHASSQRDRAMEILSASRHDRQSDREALREAVSSYLKNDGTSND